MTEPVPDDVTRDAANKGYEILLNYRQPDTGGRHPYVVHPIQDPSPPDYVTKSAGNLADLRELIDGLPAIPSPYGTEDEWNE